MSRRDHVNGQPTIDDANRRSFLAKITFVLAGLIGIAITVPGLGFVLAPVFRKQPRKWRPVGKLDSFQVGATVLVELEDPSPEPWAGVTARTGAWLRRLSEDRFIAFSINCRHLGCPVRWINEARLFMCPCHGGVYYQDGTVAGGPPPEPLKQYHVRVRGGQVEIETSPMPLTTTASMS